MQGSLATSFRRPTWLGAAALLAAAGLAGGRRSLLEVPGYELGMLGCLVAVLLGAPLGIGAARRELDRREPSAPRAFLSAAAALVALLAVLLATSASRAALLSPCSATAGAAFFPLLALPSALVASALGTACGFAARGRRLAGGLLYALLAAGFLAATLAEAWRGPAAYAFDPLFGYWPGPIYDEALRVDGRLVLHRLSAIFLSGALAAASWLGLAAARRRRTALPLAVVVLSLAATASLRAAMSARGELASRAGLAAALGGERLGRRCLLYYPGEKAPDEAERLFRDCEISAAEVAADLGLANPPRATVFVYRNAHEKRRLAGAGRTDFTKPWLAEVHVNDAPAPHPSLRHELVHALASAFARGPLKVPARFGVWVEAGLVEGLAVAVDLPRGEWTAHEWARAMRDLGLMPSAASLVGPTGFFGAAPARAYTAAGSFIAFLLERHGTEPLGRVYGGAGFAAAFGRPLSALEAEWAAFLDGVAVPAELRASAEARFRPESLFARRCAREVAGLEASASKAAEDGRGSEAVALWRRAASLSGDPGDLRAAGDALRRSDPLRAEEAYREALERAGSGQPALRAALLGALGDSAWRAGDAARAREQYRGALALDPERGEARLLAAKLAALADAALAEAAGPWLLQEGDPALALARVARSDSPLAAYLAGRAFASRGAPRHAIPLLARAALSPLPDASFGFEARRLLAQARCAAGEWEQGISGFVALGRDAARAADQARAADGARRCRMERDLFAKPVEAPPDWSPVYGK